MYLTWRVPVRGVGRTSFQTPVFGNALLTDLLRVFARLSRPGRNTHYGLDWTLRQQDPVCSSVPVCSSLAPRKAVVKTCRTPTSFPAFPARAPLGELDRARCLARNSCVCFPRVMFLPEALGP